MPPTIAPGALTRHEDGLYYKASNLMYRVTGLAAFNLDRMRITLKAFPPNNGGAFHIDTLDLYQSRGRQAFADDCKRVFKNDAESIQHELNDLINVLEKERVRMLSERDKPVVPTMTEQERKEAFDTLKDKNLTQSILDDFNAIGLVGESHNKLIGYLAAVSRLLPDPLGLLILSRSGAGKTYLQDAICKFIPEESVIKYTRLTGQALFYRDPYALKNKVMAIEEEEGMQQALYSIRTLQSSQKLSISTTRTDPKTGKFHATEYTVYGPTVVMISTTNPDALDPETRQRFLILTIDESTEQTKKILHVQRTKHSYTWFKSTFDESSITKLHHNMQRLLKPLTPMFPDGLKIQYPFSRLQMRREQGKYLSLIRSITLLHQYQRKRGTMQRKGGDKFEYVMVTKQDMDLALELGRQVFARNVDDVTPTGRALLTGISGYLLEKFEDYKKRHPKQKPPDIYEIPFTRKELRDRIGWSEAQVRQNIQPLVELGYLGILNGRHGATFRYILLDDGRNDPQMEL